MSSLRVLLVDDEVAFTDTLAKVLRRRGLTVDICQRGSQALETVTTHSYDVVLLDVKMPDRDGLVVLADIKENRPEIPVILLTGHLSLGEQERGLASGAFAYLLKPHPFADLLALIESAGRPTYHDLERSDEQP